MRHGPRDPGAVRLDDGLATHCRRCVSERAEAVCSVVADVGVRWWLLSGSGLFAAVAFAVGLCVCV